MSSWHGRVPIYPKKAVRGRFWTLAADGLLIIKSGFVWDGPSGDIFGLIDLTPNEPETMRASLVHDVLARAMTDGKIGYEWISTSNWLLKQMLIEDGFDRGRAQLWYSMLERFWRPYAANKPSRPVLTAPV